MICMANGHRTNVTYGRNARDSLGKQVNSTEHMGDSRGESRGDIARDQARKTCHGTRATRP